MGRTRWERRTPPPTPPEVAARRAVNAARVPRTGVGRAGTALGIALAAALGPVVIYGLVVVIQLARLLDWY